MSDALTTSTALDGATRRTEWPMVRLGDVLVYVARPVSPSLDTYYREIGIRSHGRGIFHKTPTTGAEIGSKRVFRVEPGDFVLNIVFAWEGAVAIVSDAERGMIASHRFPTFQASQDRLDVEYLPWYFRTASGRDLLGRVSPGGAGRNRTLNRTAFLDQAIPLPPLPEQRRIVTKLHAMSSKLAEATSLRERAATEARQLITNMAHRADMEDPQRVGLGWRPVKLSDVIRLTKDPHRVDAAQTYKNLGIYSFGRGLFRKAPIEGSVTSATVLRLCARKCRAARLART